MAKPLCTDETRETARCAGALWDLRAMWVSVHNTCFTTIQFQEWQKRIFFFNVMSVTATRTVNGHTHKD